MRINEGKKGGVEKIKLIGFFTCNAFNYITSFKYDETCFFILF